MSKGIMVCCLAGGLFSGSGVAIADTIGRYECNVVGTQAPEPIGDRNGHTLVSTQFSCFGVDGIFKNAVYSATNVTEWDGPGKARQLQAGGVHRTAGGLAVTQIVEGTGSMIMKDEKPIGGQSSGTAAVRFSSGTLAPISGKTLKFTTRTTGLGRFVLEFSE
ncbi:hypothetical protein [Bradyrhizobium sp.]|jgi:hypothetical protein|uniref:hypothetical protein n=1 Tax=Bradyrhizobium sp. TaxID=376 RepID=UPI002DDDB574|nr:hypothetical protein [Bradyrhizobium sp.]HEV2153954.1 hypothetical protein [Bradyrhizobium sp.]